MNVLVVEDEKIQLEDLLITLEELGHTCVAHTDDPLEALVMVEDHRPQVVLQDIHLNGKISGIELAKRIKQLYEVPVIFISSYKDPNTINSALDVQPITYLTKPIQSGDLQAALMMAERNHAAALPKELAQLEIPQDDFVFIRVGNKQLRINFYDILLVQTDAKNYCTIITADDKKYAVRITLQNLLHILPADFFLQTHRAYIINISFVDSYTEAEQTVILKKYNVPVGRTFKEAVEKRFRVI